MRLIKRVKQFVILLGIGVIMHYWKYKINSESFQTIEQRLVKTTCKSKEDVTYILVRIHAIKYYINRYIRHNKKRFLCYEQALTVMTLSKFLCLPVVMHYGIKKEIDSLSAHAWTQYKDVIISGESTYQEYTIVYTNRALE